MKEKKIMVTGAGGMLGGEIVKQLLRNENCTVFGFSSKKEKLLRLYNNHKSFKCFDYSDWEKGNIPFNQINLLFNCAFSRTSESVELARSLDFINSFINDAIYYGAGGIVNISSQSVYNIKRDTPATEDSLISPDSRYGLAKYASELLVRNICENVNCPYTNIRLGSLISLDFNSRLVNRLIEAACREEALIINDGTQKISFLDIRDAAEGLINLSNMNLVSIKKVYNLGSDEIFTLIDLAKIIKEKIEETYHSRIEIIVNKENVEHNNSLDSRLFYADTLWRPKYDIRFFIEEKINEVSQKNTLYF